MRMTVQMHLQMLCITRHGVSHRISVQWMCVDKINEYPNQDHRQSRFVVSRHLDSGIPQTSEFSVQASVFSLFFLPRHPPASSLSLATSPFTQVSHQMPVVFFI